MSKALDVSEMRFLILRIARVPAADPFSSPVTKGAVTLRR
jgi:hypothetical protein